MSDALYLNVGCGLVAPQDWINIDGSYSAIFAKSPVTRPLARWLRGASAAEARGWPTNITVMDVRRGLPYRDGSVNAVYASHFLEHLSLADARRFLRECHRVVRPGGYVRFIVPDLLTLSARYVDAKRSGAKAEAATEYLEALACWPIDDRSILPLRVLRAWKQFNVHKWFYDSDSLAAFLEECGFRNARPVSFLDSGIDRLPSVEKEDRFVNAIGVEATR